MARGMHLGEATCAKCNHVFRLANAIESADGKVIPSFAASAIEGELIIKCPRCASTEPFGTFIVMHDSTTLEILPHWLAD